MAEPIEMVFGITDLGGPREPCIRWSSDTDTQTCIVGGQCQTNPFAAVRGDNMMMQHLVKILWSLVYVCLHHRKILWVLWTAKKTNESGLNKGGVKRELLDTVRARQLAYHGHTMRKQSSCLEKEIMQ